MNHLSACNRRSRKYMGCAVNLTHVPFYYWERIPKLLLDSFVDGPQRVSQFIGEEENFLQLPEVDT
jgi:hypothetical protein